MADMIKIWFKHDQNIPTKIMIDPGQYQTTYKGNTFKPTVRVPQATTDDMPIIFTKIVNPPPSETQEFAAPGTCKELSCKGRPCVKRHKCRDWKIWTQVNKDRWNDCDYKCYGMLYHMP
ncbi:unnamed protein product [Adineta steineri]|uniref:Uncharacterized protein n=1 Tax=Adineta steineri TaxID=433720 RepID=A0A820ANA2_9BILA|nr:unnamed protein product [Adineta steineri]